MARGQDDEFRGILDGFDPNAADNPFERRRDAEPIGAYLGENDESRELRDDIL